MTRNMTEDNNSDELTKYTFTYFNTLAAPVLPGNSTGLRKCSVHYAEYSCYVAAVVRWFVGQLHYIQDVLRLPSRMQHTI